MTISRNLVLLLIATLPVISLQSSFDGLPEEIQEMILMIAGENTKRYDCSKKSNGEWMQTGEKSAHLALYYICSGIFFQLLGWPVIWIYLTKFKATTSAYKVFKIIALIGFVEITEGYGNSIWPGLSLLVGTVYCSNPTATTIFGKVTMIQWLLGTLLVIFLGLQRIVDLTKKGEFLLNTKSKCVFWIAIMIGYSIYGSFFFDTLLFNSEFKAPMLDPMIGIPEIEYSNTFLRVHNIAVSAVIVITYSNLVIIHAFYKCRISSNYTTNFQKKILIQSLCVSSTYVIPALCFVSMYLFKPPMWFFLFSDLTYQLSGGIPFVMYFCTSQTVRKEVLKIYGFGRNQDSSAFSVVSFIDTTTL